MKTALTLACVALSFGSCKMTEPPTTSATATAMTQYVFRGVPFSANPVLQGSITTDFQIKDDERVRVTTWGSMSLTGGNGDALFSDSEIFDLNESRLMADYSIPMEQEWLKGLHTGVINYSYANGVGESTRELFIGTEWDWKDVTPALMLYWDVDEKDGLYLNSSVKGGFEWDEKTPGYWKVSLGLATANMNEFTNGDKDGGFSDIMGEVGATRELNANTTVNAFLGVSQVLADDDVLDSNSIETFNAWLGVGMAWGF